MSVANIPKSRSCAGRAGATRRTPRALHPIFYGSYDWHSCVHGHWLLARLLRRFPDLRRGADIRALFDEQFTPEAVAGECAYFAAPTARGFKRPYGWAWLLKLAAELTLLRRGALVARARAACRSSRAEILRIPADRRLSGALGRAFQHRLRLRLAADYADGGGGSCAGGAFSSTRRAAGTARTPIARPGASRAATTSSRPP